MSRINRAIYIAVWFIIVLITFARLEVLPALATALWFTAFYLLLTLPVRSLRIASFAMFFFIGLLLVSHATLVLQLIFGFILPPMYSSSGKFMHYVLLAPISEELAKLSAAVVVLLIWKRTGARIAYGATDLMLVGLAVGIGLNVFEDMFMGSVKMITPGGITNILVPWTEMQVTRGRPDIVTLNHAASTAFVALALGWSRYLPKIIRYLPAFCVLLWMTWCHALYNGQDLLDRGNPAFITAPLTWITPYIFFLAVIATIAFEFFVLYVHATEIERKLGQAKTSGILAWFDQNCLLRHMAYARVWLRGNPQDREKATRYLNRLTARLLHATTPA
jgi:RsiW-degrading membrane proteinase PrsW (M82 family)